MTQTSVLPNQTSNPSLNVAPKSDVKKAQKYLILSVNIILFCNIDIGPQITRQIIIQTSDPQIGHQILYKKLQNQNIKVIFADIRRRTQKGSTSIFGTVLYGTVLLVRYCFVKILVISYIIIIIIIIIIKIIHCFQLKIYYLYILY